MDFLIGRPPGVGAPGTKAPKQTDLIEAKLLAVRPARRRGESPPSAVRERRGNTEGGRDPRGGRVLILMIPDGQQLPGGLDKGIYRVFLRFVRG